MLRPLIYSIIFGCWAFSLGYDVMHIPSFRGTWFDKLKFLTIINMVIQTVYFGLCMIRAFIDTLANKPEVGPHKRHPDVPTYYPSTKFHSFVDGFYACGALPIGIFVVLMFWGLYAVDRELVYPKALDKIIPQWLNHVMHTAPGPFLLVDTMLTCHRYPSRAKGLGLILIFGALYSTSVIVYYAIEGIWVYPIFAVLNNVQRAVFIGLAVLGLGAMYLIGDAFNQLVWGETRVGSRSAKSSVGQASHPPDSRRTAKANQQRKGKTRKD